MGWNDKYIKSKNPRPTNAGTFMIEGESITHAEGAERLGISERLFSERRRALIKKLPPGEAITWDHLRGKTNVSRSSPSKASNP